MYGSRAVVHNSIKVRRSYLTTTTTFSLVATAQGAFGAAAGSLSFQNPEL